MADVFISYSRKDSQFMQRLHGHLRGAQQDVWVDWEDIPFTADWWQEICRAIDESHTFIFIITPDSVASDVCRQEIQYAVDHNKRFVPVLYRDITGVDPQLIHPAIQRHNWVPFTADQDFDAAFQRLMRALATDLDHLREHTRLLLRAKEWGDRNYDRSYLLRGSEVADAQRWLASSRDKDPRPTALQLDYIVASQAAQSQRQRRGFVGVVTALGAVVVLLVVAVLLFIETQRVRQQLAISDATNVALATRVAEDAGAVVSEAARNVGAQQTTVAERTLAPGAAQTATALGIQKTATGPTPTRTPTTLATAEGGTVSAAVPTISATPTAAGPTSIPTSTAIVYDDAATPAATQTESISTAEAQVVPPAATNVATCADAPPIRLAPGLEGYVLDTVTPFLNVRSGPGTDNEKVAELEAMRTFTVMEGPVCNEGFSWFNISWFRLDEDGEGIVERLGWVAEGDQTEYYTGLLEDKGQWFVNATTGSDEAPCDHPDEACVTIAAALALAADGDTIAIANGVYTETLLIEKDVRLAGDYLALTVINGRAQSTTITIAEGASVILQNMTITGGSVEGDGGGIRNNGDLTLRNTRVTSNFATASGGGVATFGDLTVLDSRFDTNSARDGSAIYVAENASLSLAGENIFSGNSTADPEGEEIYSLTEDGG